MTRPIKTSHYAAVKDSKRLQAVLFLLYDFKSHTTRDIINATGVCAVNSIVHEIRQNGFPVKCTYKETTDTGARVYEYQLQREAL